MNIVENVRTIIEPIINENNYILDDIMYVQEGNTKFLRVIIDKKGVVDIDDCVKVFKLIEPIIDEKDPINESYILDVCSKEKGSL